MVCFVGSIHCPEAIGATTLSGSMVSPGSIVAGNGPASRKKAMGLVNCALGTFSARTLLRLPRACQPFGSPRFVDIWTLSEGLARPLQLNFNEGACQLPGAI